MQKNKFFGWFLIGTITGVVTGTVNYFLTTWTANNFLGNVLQFGTNSVSILPSWLSISVGVALSSAAGVWAGLWLVTEKWKFTL